MDMLAEALPAIDAVGGQLALIGTGDKPLETQFLAAAQARPGRMAVVIGYEETLAHLVQAGADALLVPSRYEPCGLTQLCAMRYGCVPVVARVGGLADTIVDANEMALAAGAGTGVQFSPVSPEMLALAIDRTSALWRDRPVWRGMQRRAMAVDVGWHRPARHYAALYRELVASRAP
jgi:starch synthase